VNLYKEYSLYNGKMTKSKESTKERIRRLKLGKELLKEKRRLERQRLKALKEKSKIEGLKAKRRKKVVKRLIGNALQPYSYKPKLSKSLLNIGAGFVGGSGTKRVKQTPGRPRGIYKHKDPFTGKPIPATLFYRRIREYKRVQQQMANKKDLEAIKQLAKRGIPPEQAKEIIDRSQLQNVQGQRQNIQIKQVVPRQIPNNYPSQAVRPIWRNREGWLDYDWTIAGKKVVVRGTPQSFWN